MNPQQLQQVQVAAPLIAAGLFVLALLLMLLAVYYFRRSRTDFYWRSRRKAGQLGWRVFVVSMFLTLVSGVICVIIGVSSLITSRIAQAPTPLPVVSPTTTVETSTEPAPHTEEPITVAPTAEATEATSTSTNTAIVTEPATATVTNTSVPSTATRRATATRAATATPTITVTPSETFLPAAPVLTLTIESSVTPNPEAALEITALSVQISSELEPVEPADSFDAGFKRVYFFVTFEQMQPGVLWRRKLLHNGDTLDEMAYTWGLEQQGTTYFFFGREEGFQPGQYEIRLYIGETTSPAAAAQFNVK